MQGTGLPETLYILQPEGCGGEMKEESSLGSMFLFKRRDIEGNNL